MLFFSILLYFLKSIFINIFIANKFPSPNATVIACSKCPLLSFGSLCFGQNISNITGDIKPFGDGKV